jgi:hypothetical protein
MSTELWGRIQRRTKKKEYRGHLGVCLRDCSIGLASWPYVKALLKENLERQELRVQAS